MVRTYGLTHIALAVRDLERSVRFYSGVFGAKVMYRDAGFVRRRWIPGHGASRRMEPRSCGIGAM
jgi:catechol 2,3-dioxygenase-like lactoylglutathione lyase family enzyme